MAREQASGQRRHVPQRMCVVCHQTSDKRTLTRIVRTPDEGVIVDVTGKRNGRGAYLCEQDACWEQALATAILDRALRTTLAEADRMRLREQRPQR